MIVITEKEGSGFELIRKFKGRFRLQDAMSYYGIYDNAIYTASGHVVVGFYMDFSTFTLKNDFLNLFKTLNPDIEITFQFYLVHSKTFMALFLFVTIPFPYLSSHHTIRNILFGLSEKYTQTFFKRQNQSLNKELNSIRALILSIYPESSNLTDLGLHGFLNILLNKNLNLVSNIKNHIHDDFDFKYSHYTYNNRKTIALILKNFPQEDIFPDLLFNSNFDFPFILQITVTRPTRKTSNSIFFAESDYASQLESIFKSAGKTFDQNSFGRGGEALMLTQSIGDYVFHYNCTAHFSDTDADKLVQYATRFQKRFRDFSLMFSQEQLELINVASSFFPGLSFLFQDKLDILNPDLKYLLPFKKGTYKTLFKEEDKYPEFIPEAPPPISEAVFKTPAFKKPSSSGDDPDILPDEEKQAQESLEKDTAPVFALGTKKNPQSQDMSPKTFTHIEDIYNKISNIQV